MKIYKYSLILVSILFLFACEKETEGLSSITIYPTIELKGEVASTILLGGTYTESGFVAMEGETDITAETVVTGTVNSAVPGVYTITYKATNVDGFSISKRRYVGVIAPAAAAMDISGQYRRNAGANGIATITKTEHPGLYINNNPGGIAIIPGSNEIFIYMFHTEPTKVSAPLQATSVGDFACINGVYDDINKLYKWVCINPGYGTAVRTFIKQ